MSITPAQVKSLALAAVIRNTVSPFLVGAPVLVHPIAAAAATFYGVNHPGTGDTTKYQKFLQSVTGNKAFKLATAIATAPTQTSGGAVSAANQLQCVVLKNGVPVPHSRDDQVAAASSFCVGVGGGTAIADATLEAKGTTAANLLAGATSLSIASTGANTKTILVGDIIAIAGDSTVYRATATSTALNGTTEVLLPITPPLQANVTATTDIPVEPSHDRTVLFATAPAVNDVIEIMSFDSDDVANSGSVAAGAIAEWDAYSFMTASATGQMIAAK